MKRVIAILVTLAAGSTMWGADADAPIRQRGKAVAEAAFKELSGNLQKAIADGGFTNAIDFCSRKALPLTLQIATHEGVKLQRVSHKPRNPANRAGADELELINRFRAELASGGTPKPVVQSVTAGASVFYAPIVINNPLCLNCHGEPQKEIAGDTLAAIKSRYPKDEATGFKMNELRGMWRIEIPNSKQP